MTFLHIHKTKFPHISHIYFHLAFMPASYIASLINPAIIPDNIAGGKISPLLTPCGVKFQADWWDPPSESRSIWWLVPEHPIFHEPNDGMSLAHYSIHWVDDVGDFIKTIPAGDATLLAGHLAWEKSSHGTL
ncbi:MAG: hypothetical protein KAT29_04950, partial [Anaerolineales bacterium]|nr:hypothetical protein [Anaerolineales bacterium]